MNYYLAGYTSIITNLPPKEGSIKAFSPSTMLNHVFPDCWALSWVTTEEIEKHIIKEHFQIT